MILMKKSGWDILTTESPTEHRSFEYLRCFMNGLKRYGLKGPRKLPCQCKHDQGAVPKMATWLMDVDGFGIFKTTKLYKYSVGYGRINKDQLGLAGNCIYIYNLFIYFIYLFNSFYWFIYLVLFIHDASSIINLVSSISIDCKEIKGSETKKTPSSHPLPPASVAASGAQLYVQPPTWPRSPSLLSLGAVDPCCACRKVAALPGCDQLWGPDGPEGASNNASGAPRWEHLELSWSFPGGPSFKHRWKPLPRAFNRFNLSVFSSSKVSKGWRCWNQDQWKELELEWERNTSLWYPSSTN